MAQHQFLIKSRYFTEFGLVFLIKWYFGLKSGWFELLCKVRRVLEYERGTSRRIKDAGETWIFGPRGVFGRVAWSWERRLRNFFFSGERIDAVYFSLFDLCQNGIRSTGQGNEFVDHGIHMDGNREIRFHRLCELTSAILNMETRSGKNKLFAFLIK